MLHGTASLGTNQDCNQTLQNVFDALCWVPLPLTKQPKADLTTALTHIQVVRIWFYKIDLDRWGKKRFYNHRENPVCNKPHTSLWELAWPDPG